MFYNRCTSLNESNMFSYKLYTIIYIMKSSIIRYEQFACYYDYMCVL